MSKFNDPFNPKSGEFRKNIRDISEGDDTELRASMKEFGWLSKFPAVVDESEVIIVGHRRLKIAKELGIEPVIEKFTFGSGDQADAERLKLALASNIGFKAMTRDDRKRIAQYLYGKAEWTMERIGEALNVSTATAARDVGEFSHGEKIKPSKTSANPKGAGRPKGNGAKTKAAKPRNERAPKAAEREDKIAALRDAGLSTAEIAAEIGIGPRAVDQAIEHVDIRREAEAQIDPATLSVSAQEKLQAAIRQHIRKLDAEFEQRVVAEIKSRIDEIVLPSYREGAAKHDMIIKARKGIMDKVTYRLIWSCLHSDSRKSVSEDRLNKAFHIWTDIELLLLDEKQSTTAALDMPATYADLMERKRKVSEARKARRGHQTPNSPATN